MLDCRSNRIVTVTCAAQMLCASVIGLQASKAQHRMPSDLLCQNQYQRTSRNTAAMVPNVDFDKNIHVQRL
jgi:hypothetical protein